MSYFRIFQLFFSCVFVFVIFNLKDPFLRNYFESFKIKAHTQLQNNRHFLSNISETEYWISTNKAPLSLCPILPPGLGPINIDFEISDPIEEAIFQNPDVSFGGHSKPKNCTALQRIAIIIPFRNRETHLHYWLFYMHPFLQKQQGDYGIYVIEQHGESKFNRAKLMNVGYAEAVKDYDYNCFIFSDVDIIPLDLQNLYRCSKKPKHMAHSLDKFNFRLPYKNLFGGIVAFTKEHYLKVNGFSNTFWGWGGEDDELFQRVKAAGLSIERASSNISRARVFKHKRDRGNERNVQNVRMIYKAKSRMNDDGLSSLKYTVISFTKHRLYKKITVDIGSPPGNLSNSSS